MKQTCGVNMEDYGPPLVTVVVPCYNIAEYIAECLESLVSQTFDCYEVVCIDDGSTDDTGRILDSYALEYPFVRVFHTRNEGLSEARNRGVRLSRSKLITFVDGDDFVSPYYLQVLFDAHDGLPGRMVCACIETGPRKLLRDLKWDGSTRVEGVYSREEAECAWLLNRISSIPYARLAHRHLYERAPFAEGAIFEDIIAIADQIPHIAEIVTLDTVVYAYVRREGSISRPHAITEEYVQAYRNAVLHVKETVTTWPIDLQEQASWKLASLYQHLASHASRLSDAAIALMYTREARDYVRPRLRKLVLLCAKYRLPTFLMCRLVLLATSPMLHLYAVRLYRRIKHE